MQGKIGGRDVAIKVWNPAVRGAADAFKREAEVHNALKDQPHIPVWVACGYVAHSFCPFTATAWAGEPVPMQQGRVLPQHRTGMAMPVLLPMSCSLCTPTPGRRNAVLCVAADYPRLRSSPARRALADI